MAGKRLLYEISIIRPTVIFLLVVYHALCIYTGGWTKPEGVEPNTLYWWLGHLISGFRIETIAFVGGYVFSYQCLELNRRSRFFPFLWKKVKRLIIPAIIFGLIYYMLFKFSPQSFKWTIFPWKILNGVGHLWFLPMLFWCFILSWLIDAAYSKIQLRNPQAAEICAWILLVLLAALSVWQPAKLRLGLTRVPHFIFYFYMGYWLRHLMIGKESIPTSAKQLLTEDKDMSTMEPVPANMETSAKELITEDKDMSTTEPVPANMETSAKELITEDKNIREKETYTIDKIREEETISAGKGIHKSETSTTGKKFLWSSILLAIIYIVVLCFKLQVLKIQLPGIPWTRPPFMSGWSPLSIAYLKLIHTTAGILSIYFFVWYCLHRNTSSNNEHFTNHYTERNTNNNTEDISNSKIKDITGSADVPQPGPLLQYASRLCYGVYVYHMFFMEWLYFHTSLPATLSSCTLGAWTLPWVVFLITLTLSAAATWLTLKSRFGRMLIG